MPSVTPFDFARIEVITFDCYGTLIDWEAGILKALRQVIDPTGDDDDLLESYARHEARLEAGTYRPYREILSTALTDVAMEHGAQPDDQQRADFGASVTDWPAFSDSAAALAALRRRYRLAVITNCDDDLFAASNVHLGEPFTWIVTAAQAGAYKPDHRNFEVALDRIGIAPEGLLHTAQSLYHDHVPAKELGLSTCWIDRRHGTAGFGATLPATAEPDVTAQDMATFARMALA